MCEHLAIKHGMCDLNARQTTARKNAPFTRTCQRGCSHRTSKPMQKRVRTVLELMLAHAMLAGVDCAIIVIVAVDGVAQLAVVRCIEAFVSG